MFIDIKKIGKDIQEMLSEEDLLKEISQALRQITNILNNPFISKIFRIRTPVKFGMVEIDDEEYSEMIFGENELESVFLDSFSEGMVLNLVHSDTMDGIHIIKEITENSIIFLDKTKSTRREQKVSFYALDLPQGSESIIAGVIDITRIDMRDLAGLSKITQGTDIKEMKLGSHLRHYITKMYDGYFYQTNDIFEGFKKS